MSEALNWVFQRHGVATLMKSHMTLKRMLVHPKDKWTSQENTGVVYQVPSKDCLCMYTGNREKAYVYKRDREKVGVVREKEHKRDVNKTLEEKYTRARKKDSVSEAHSLAIMN